MPCRAKPAATASPWFDSHPSGLLDYAVFRFAALAARAFARFATSAAFRAGDISFFAGALFAAGFSALWIAAHRFFVAAMILAIPSLLM